MHRWKGQTHAAFVILTVRTPMPVTARYSSGAEMRYDKVAVVCRYGLVGGEVGVGFGDDTAWWR